jgi:RNA polymerase sigma factor (sigma-70 family)
MQHSEENRWVKKHLLPHEPMLRAWLRNRFSTGVDIDDVIQESYMRVLKARAKGEIKAPKAFLFATARNFALNAVRSAYIRGETSEVGLEDADIIDSSRGVAETIARNQELEILTKAIQSLPDRCRQIFTLRKVYGMPQREIAKKLGISARTVNAQISIGINKCMGYVESYRGE